MRSRLAVKAAPVHPTDSVPRQRGVQGVPPPGCPGWDCAGVVESVGPEVRRHLAVGDEVMAIDLPWRPEGGAQTELLVAPAAIGRADPGRRATLEAGVDAADERADRASAVSSRSG